MFAFLKNHPFAVEAWFDRSVVVTFAVPKEQVISLIPECLILDTLNDQWAFIAVAMVQTRHLRPKGFPDFLGNDFFLAGYRVFVQYHTAAGKRLRGLYILKSEADKKLMTLLGNIFTHYNYTFTDISMTSGPNGFEVQSRNSGFQIRLGTGTEENVHLPENSPFADWKEARRFAGPLPFTFSYNAGTREVLIIEGVRQNWKPMPLQWVSGHFSFLDALELEGLRSANAFMVEHVPYHWKKGRKEIWKG